MTTTLEQEKEEVRKRMAVLKKLKVDVNEVDIDDPKPCSKIILRTTTAFV
jgi:hypothetical protein